MVNKKSIDNVNIYMLLFFFINDFSKYFYMKKFYDIYM